MVQAPDKIALSGLARDGRVQRGIQDHLGLLKCCQGLIKVAQELKEPVRLEKLMRPRTCSISGALRAVHGTGSGLHALRLGCPLGKSSTLALP